MKNIRIWQFIYKNLTENTPICLLIVVKNQGSSPGRVGFKMAVNIKYEILGTIGGGNIEYNLVNQAINMLKNRDFSPTIKHKILNNTLTDESNMICGGEQSVLLYPLQKSSITTVYNILNTIKDDKAKILYISPCKMTISLKSDSTKQFEYDNEDKWQYIEHLGTVNQAYIIGGGHVGLALSQVLSMLDFHITLLDNRKDISTFENNLYANRKYIISYQKVQDYIQESKKTFVFIMTTNHLEDKLVLKKLIDKEFYYIGLLGSRTKIKKIMNSLYQEGISKEKLQKVKSPIGLNIKSQTAIEIAISITSEVILLYRSRT